MLNRIDLPRKHSLHSHDAEDHLMQKVKCRWNIVVKVILSYPNYVNINVSVDRDASLSVNYPWGPANQNN